MENELARSQIRLSAVKIRWEKEIWRRKALDKMRASAASRAFDRSIFRDLRRHLARVTSADSPDTPGHVLCTLSTGAWTGRISNADGGSCDMPAGTSS
jgi:hypothetical protein